MDSSGKFYDTVPGYQANLRQMKEEKFLEDLKQMQITEKLNESRCQTKIGRRPVTNQDKRFILSEREIDYRCYKQREGLDLELPLCRIKTECETKRSVLPATSSEPPYFRFNFDVVVDKWPHRIQALNRFIQAARIVMTQFRIRKRLENFHRFFDSQKEDSSTTVGIKDSILSLSNDVLDPKDLCLFLHQQNASLLTSELHFFPLDNLICDIPITPQPLPIQEPLLHQLLGYKQFDVYEARTNYLPIAPRPHPEPQCVLETYLSCLPEALEIEKPKEQEVKVESSVILDAPPDKLFEPPEIDVPSLFNPSPTVPRVFSFQLPTELDTVYPLFPMNYWQPHDSQHPSLTVEELTDQVSEWNYYNFPLQGYFDRCELPQEVYELPGIIQQGSENILSVAMPPLEEEISRECREIIEGTDLRALDYYPVTHVPLEKALVELESSLKDTRKEETVNFDSEETP